MLVERASYDWAYFDDIPGSRCGPDDGPWPRSYQVLEEPEVWRELSVLAKPQSMQSSCGGFRADSVNFQPCPRTRTQDRYIVQELNIHGKIWTLTGVFDGHLGDTTVEHVSYHLPIIVRDSLRSAYQGNPHRAFSPEFIGEMLSRSITAFDDAIAQDVLSLFGGMEGLAEYTDAEIRRIINDQYHGGANYSKTKLCMYGTTALVALVDPEHTSLWLAQLGDCQAVMASLDDVDGEWKVETLTSEQNGDNEAEIDRVRREHPGESECIVDRRVLGALAPTRCLGDVPFKQPPEFSRRILYNLLPGFQDTSPWEEFLARNNSPPYISSVPEITYHRLDSSQSKRYLILSSDGFTDLCSSRGQQRIITRWAYGMDEVHTLPPSPTTGLASKQANMALRLLREALGGDDNFSVSRVLTLDMDVAWIDDTAIVVQTL